VSLDTLGAKILDVIREHLPALTPPPPPAGVPVGTVQAFFAELEDLILRHKAAIVAGLDAAETGAAAGGHPLVAEALEVAEEAAQSIPAAVQAPAPPAAPQTQPAPQPPAPAVQAAPAPPPAPRPNVFKLPGAR
jgi:hypothetical protein